jgi:hypothetical protein
VLPGRFATIVNLAVFTEALVLCAMLLASDEAGRPGTYGSLGDELGCDDLAPGRVVPVVDVRLAVVSDG